MRLSIIYEYIHAEKLTENITGNININVQLTFPSSPNIVVTPTELKARFIANITSTPPVLNITLKGVLAVSGDPKNIKKIEENIKNKKPDPPLIHFLTSHILFESALLARELGLPPAMPLPQPGPPRGGPKDIGTFKPV